MAQQEFETVTFANYAVLDHSVYELGRQDESSTGVIEEMATAFGYELAPQPDVDNLGGLIGAVGPAKELQENIGRVQDVLGTDRSAVDIARSWVERTGLLVPVARDYLSAEVMSEFDDVHAAIMTGGVRNWMQRRANRMIKLVAETNFVLRGVLVGGTRQMKTVEGPDVTEGMTESDYLEDVIRPMMLDADVEVDVVRPATDKGNEVADAAAAHVAMVLNNKQQVAHIAVVSNAGAWVQNGGQLLSALERKDVMGERGWATLSVVSDSFPLGTGEEPTSTHQNPFTALGQIARNAQELTRH